VEEAESSIRSDQGKWGMAWLPVLVPRGRLFAV